MFLTLFLTCVAVFILSILFIFGNVILTDMDDFSGKSMIPFARNLFPESPNYVSDRCSFFRFFPQ